MTRTEEGPLVLLPSPPRPPLVFIVFAVAFIAASAVAAMLILPYAKSRTITEGLGLMLVFNFPLARPLLDNPLLSDFLVALLNLAASLGALLAARRAAGILARSGGRIMEGLSFAILLLGYSVLRLPVLGYAFLGDILLSALLLFCLFFLILRARSPYLRSSLAVLLSGQLAQVLSFILPPFAAVDYFQIKVGWLWLAPGIYNLADFVMMLGWLILVASSAFLAGRRLLRWLLRTDPSQSRG